MFIVLIPFFQPNRKSPYGFNDKLLENVLWPRISFQLLSSQFSSSFYATGNFFQVSESFCHF